jgi:hypothetical protein
MGGLTLLWAGEEDNSPLPDDEDGLLGSETGSLQRKETIKKIERKTKPIILELPSCLFRNRRGVRTDELFCPRVQSCVQDSSSTRIWVTWSRPWRRTEAR